MDGNTTVKYLQNYIRAKDFQPDWQKIISLNFLRKLENWQGQSEKVYIWVIHRRLRVLLMKKYGM